MGNDERTDIAHPHDLFVRNTLADTELAADFLRNYLPPEWGGQFEAGIR